MLTRNTVSNIEKHSISWLDYKFKPILYFDMKKYPISEIAYQKMLIYTLVLLTRGVAFSPFSVPKLDLFHISMEEAAGTSPAICRLICWLANVLSWLKLQYTMYALFSPNGMILYLISAHLSNHWNLVNYQPNKNWSTYSHLLSTMIKASKMRL